MAYVTVPKDLTHVKSKVVFGLTKRQLIFNLDVARFLPMADIYGRIPGSIKRCSRCRIIKIEDDSFLCGCNWAVYSNIIYPCLYLDSFFGWIGSVRWGHIPSVDIYIDLIIAIIH